MYADNTTRHSLDDLTLSLSILPSLPLSGPPVLSSPSSSPSALAPAPAPSLFTSHSLDSLPLLPALSYALRASLAYPYLSHAKRRAGSSTLAKQHCCA